MRLIKELKGHSGATVSLFDNNVVVKTNYNKARQSASILQELPFHTPEIYEIEDDTITMEYINGEDIRSLLEHHGQEGLDLLIKFIEQYFDWCLANSSKYIFTNEVDEKIFQLGDYINLESIKSQLQYDMPRSLIHGDFTFDNIIFKDGKFYLIDANPTYLNSIHFDGSKLRQDIDGFWFMRNVEDKLNYKISCLAIGEQLKSKYDFMRNNNLYVFMLSRILPYTKDEKIMKFLSKELKRAWP